MKISLLPLAGIFPALTILPVHGQAGGVPVLSTPGTATWSNEVTDTGTRTVFTITDNTVIDWGQFNLNSGSELVFDFVGGESVVNMLNGTSTHLISGVVTSNGNVGFFAPNAPIRVTATGSVTAANVTIATMDVDPAAFNAGGAFTMTSASGATLTVAGTVSATDGNVLLAGQKVRVAGTGALDAAKAIRIAGGGRVDVSSGGAGRRLKVSDGGFVLHQGISSASRIEIAAGKEITNGGRLDVGPNQRIFLEVGSDGKVLKEGNGLMVGRVSIKGAVDPDGITIDPAEADSAAAVSSAVLNMPALKRPDGSTASNSRTMVSNVPMSASADGSRDRKRTGRQVASREKPLLKRTSFFGMRGGSSGTKR